jgi:hypothetical protein
MGSKQKRHKQTRLKNKFGKKVLSGKMTVDEARGKLGRDLARKSGYAPVIKAVWAHGKATAEAEFLAEKLYLATEPMREAAAALKAARPVTEEDLLAAARPMSSPTTVTKAAAAPVRREDPQRQLMLIKSMQAERAAELAARPAHFWTGVEKGLLNIYRTDTDPQAREAARQALVNKGIVI